MKADRNEFFRTLEDEARRPLDPMELLYPEEVPYFEKYDEFVPEDLIRKGFAYDILGIDEMKMRIAEITKRQLAPPPEVEIEF